MFQPPLLNNISWKHVSIEPSNFALYWLNCSKSHFYFKCEFPFSEDLCMNNSWRRIHQPTKFDTCKMYTHSKFRMSMNRTFISFPFFNEFTYFNFTAFCVISYSMSYGDLIEKAIQISLVIQLASNPSITFNCSLTILYSCLSCFGRLQK